MKCNPEKPTSAILPGFFSGRFKKDFAVVFSGKVLSAALGFVATLLIARHFSDAEFGILTAALVVMQMASAVAEAICIDFSDHFSHSDNSILPINFLQFDDMEWERLAGNRYMYHNRLRVDDFANIFRDTDLRILSMDAIINEKAREELREGFPLDDRFVRKNIDTNATTCAWVVASNNENQE